MAFADGKAFRISSLWSELLLSMSACYLSSPAPAGSLQVWRTRLDWYLRGRICAVPESLTTCQECLGMVLLLREVQRCLSDRFPIHLHVSGSFLGLGCLQSPCGVPVFACHRNGTFLLSWNTQYKSGLNIGTESVLRAATAIDTYRIDLPLHRVPVCQPFALPERSTNIIPRYDDH